MSKDKIDSHWALRTACGKTAAHAARKDKTAAHAARKDKTAANSARKDKTAANSARESKIAVLMHLADNVRKRRHTVRYKQHRENEKTKGEILC